jgi:hypothetical protein
VLRVARHERQTSFTGSGKLARALRQDEMLQGPKGTIWRPANAEEAAEYQLDSAVLKQLADDPGAKSPAGAG